MKNEKHFSQNIEQHETKPKIYSVTFNRYPWSFSDERVKISPQAVADNELGGHSWLPGAVNTWWSQICSENNLNPEEKRLKKIKSCLNEIARNAFEKVGGGEIKVIFESKKVTITVTDQGHGFKNPNENILAGHGLHQVKSYADEFTIETNGKKFTKIKDKKEFIETENTNIQQGSKISFIKKIE